MLGLSHFAGNKRIFFSKKKNKLGWKKNALHRTEMLWGKLFDEGQILVSMIRV